MGKKKERISIIDNSDGEELFVLCDLGNSH